MEFGSQYCHKCHSIFFPHCQAKITSLVYDDDIVIRGDNGRGSMS